MRCGGWISIHPLAASNDAANRNLNRVQVVPITSKVARVYPCDAAINLNGEARKAMADQIATVSKKRFRSRMGFWQPMICAQLGLP